MVVSPHVYCGSEEKSVERFPELSTACAVTQAMSRATQCQENTDSPVERIDTLEGLTNTFLYDDNKGSSPSAIVPILEDPLHKLTVEERGEEADGCASLSQAALIAEQDRDPKIICLRPLALDEKKEAVAACYYFKKEGILMRKWQPKAYLCLDPSRSSTCKFMATIILLPLWFARLSHVSLILCFQEQ